MDASDFDYCLDVARDSLTKAAATDMTPPVHRIQVSRMKSAVGELETFLPAGQYTRLLGILQAFGSTGTREEAAYNLQLFDVLRPTLTPVGPAPAARLRQAKEASRQQ
jgi:hypothetical protein